MQLPPRALYAGLFAILVSACSSSKPPTTAVASVPPETPAHKLLVQANACWFGGIWTDAERDAPVSLRPRIDARCREVLRAVYSGDDDVHLQQLRAFEHGVIEDLAARIEDLAARSADDGSKKVSYTKLLLATAATQREAMAARRAADRVKRDLDHEPEKLTKDEADAVGPLLATKELENLLAMDAGDLAYEARTIGYIAAMDHMALSRGLPKHLKVYALSGTMKALFGAEPPPDMPTDATKPLKNGLYLSYLTDVARAAAHPVPDAAKAPKDREPLAWSGALEGVGEKIAANAERLPQNTELRDVSLRISERLDDWYQAEQHALDANLRSPRPPAKKPRKAKK